MRLLPWILSWFMPLCGTQGANGVPQPGVVDFAHLVPMSHSEALIAPAGFHEAPDITAPIFPAPAKQLFAALQMVAAAQPRSYLLDAEPAALQAAYVVRSAAANFPDVVELEAVPMGPASSSYILYSYAVYGVSDYGVNLGHAKNWACALEKREDNKASCNAQ